VTDSTARIRRSAWRVAVLVIVTVAVLGYLSDLLVLSFHPQPLFAMLDAAVLGALSGTIAWVYQRRQNRYLAQRLEVIADMNHHVRNDLQVIQYSAYMTKDKEHIQRIEQSLGRIDWALREVLTGKQLRSGTDRGTKE
jgi:signal transduction histidine kinase